LFAGRPGRRSAENVPVHASIHAWNRSEPQRLPLLQMCASLESAVLQEWPSAGLLSMAGRTQSLNVDAIINEAFERNCWGIDLVERFEAKFSPLLWSAVWPANVASFPCCVEFKRRT
jgi:hypothetical protein